jgi:hypothetical protein
MWTADSLERALRSALLSRATVKVGRLPLAKSADVEWSESGGKARVRIDNHDVGLRPGVLHELLHVVLDESLRQFSDELQEPAIEAWERLMDIRISKSKRRLAWWRKTIDGMRR